MYLRTKFSISFLIKEDTTHNHVIESYKHAKSDINYKIVTRNIISHLF